MNIKAIQASQFNPLSIHNNVSRKQLALSPGDLVDYMYDDGNVYTRKVRTKPHQMRGRGRVWVIWLEGKPGCVALCRCQPHKNS